MAEEKEKGKKQKVAEDTSFEALKFRAACKKRLWAGSKSPLRNMTPFVGLLLS